jgi:antitoxin (DNA-binding transcriptional repressor) of toxin-antitoxin stability system
VGIKYEAKHITLVITKRGVPVAQLVPVEEQSVNLYGALKGTISIKGDIVSPIEEEWEAML